MKELAPVLGIKNYNKKKKRWDGVVCQAQCDDNGKETVVIFDVMHAPTENELSKLLQTSIDTKPWLIN